MTQSPLVVWAKKARGFVKFKLAQAEEAIDVWRAPTLEKKLGVASISLRVPGVDRLCNPSIVRSGSGWLVAARRLNYRMEANGAYTVKGGIQNLSSETYLVFLGDSFRIERVQRIEDEHARMQLDVARNGFEDPRIFWFGNRLMGLWSALRLGSQPAVADTYDLAYDQEGKITAMPIWAGTTNTMVVAHLNQARMEAPIVLPSPRNAAREKNWMPFTFQDKLHLLYYLDTMEVYAVSNGKLDLVHRERDPIKQLRNWSGSSQVVEWDDGWLCVAHLAGRRIKDTFKSIGPFYFHRLIRLSKSWKLIGMSDSFFFQKKGLEFCSGMAIHDGRVIFSYGSDDDSSSIIELSTKHIAKMIKPIPP
jgi:hypothetical protein